MKILFFGDSITDARRDREYEFHPYNLGTGYVNGISGELLYSNPGKYEIINRGISGDRVIDLYARIKRDCWNLKPDVLSILIGVNDVWQEIDSKNGVEFARFEQVYKMLVVDSIKALPNTKIILCEPFVMLGAATEANYDKFLMVKEYAKIVKKIATELNLFFLPLQEKMDDFVAKNPEVACLYDGVHPNIIGAKLIANEWLKLFKEKVDK